MTGVAAGSGPAAALRSLVLLIVLYLAASLGLLWNWHAAQVNTVTGDEPWYLLIASGMVRQGTLEQQVPLAAEVEERRLYAGGLTPLDVADPQASHVVQGPHGYYSVHNIGLPALLALPLAIAGVSGAKVFLALLSSLVVVLAWLFAGTLRLTTAQRALATASVTLALPFLPAAGQVFPDIPGGLLCLLGLYWLATPHIARSPGRLWLYAVLVASMPWLQIRFAAPALVIIGALLWQAWRAGTLDRQAAMRWLLPLALSGLALCGYNAWAFGNPLGPYQSDALEFSTTSLLVLLGLHLDQNQGFLLQNPAHFLGLMGLASLLVRQRLLGIAVLLVFAALIVPNAMHPNWYGGWSFSGRFGWAAATVFVLPTLVGLARLAQGAPRTFVALVLALLALQAYFYAGYVGWLGDGNLYNRSPADRPMPWLSAYAIFYADVWRWLPAVYGRGFTGWDWPVRYAPNVVFAGMALGAVVLGLLTARRPARGFARAVAGWAGVSVIAIGLGGALGLAPDVYREPRTWQASDAGGHTGRVEDGARLVSAAKDQPHLALFGPSARLGRGPHEVTLDYASPAPTDAVIGTLEVYHQHSHTVLQEIPLMGTGGQRIELSHVVELRNRASMIEFRVFWPGSADLRIEGLRVQAL